MDDIYGKTLLFDFYGELLTDHQKAIYEEVVMEDCSLSEVAKEHGISRQGVHELIKRITRALNDYEDKLHLVERFMKIRSRVEQLKQLTNDSEITKDKLIEEIDSLSSQILEEL